MKNKKCLILLEKSITKCVDFKNYDYFIGVENGAFEILENNLEPYFFISDFDSISNEKLEILKAKGNIEILKAEKDFVDTEEAILKAVELGFSPKDITCMLGKTSRRVDHLFNLLLLVNKYHIKLMGDGFLIEFLGKSNEFKKIKKDIYKYMSIFTFNPTVISTVGLKYEINEKLFDINSGTQLISNEIVDFEAMIKNNQDILIIYSND